MVMNKDSKWMLMTYYCPIHGDTGRVEPLQITKEELSKKLITKSKASKNKLNFKKTKNHYQDQISKNNIYYLKHLVQILQSAFLTEV